MAHALIVDGDCKTAQLLEKVAQTERFSTRSADSLREARLEIGRRHPDVVLTDIRLPDGKGVELIRHIAAPASTLFVVTGQPIVDNAVNALRAGAADYLAKPVDVERVQNILRRALGKSADRIERALPFSRMVGTSACMQQLYDRP
jgi:DNA-binding NtrC family response regulator